MTTDTELSGLTLTVHIGTGKTGSSSIQRTLTAAQPVLQQAGGLAYVGLMFEEFAERLQPWQRTGSWPVLAELPLDEAHRQLGDVLQQTLRKARDAGLKGLVWSNESIFGNHAIVMPVLQAVRAQGVAVRVIVYLRRHDEWARSAYLQWGVKHKAYKGRLKSFEEWCAYRPVGFYSGLKPWLEVEWDHLLVRNFNACRDIVADFRECCGLADLAFENIRENETPPPVALALWALYNGQREGDVLPVELEPMLMAAGITNGVRRVLWNQMVPSPEALEAVARQSAPDRDRINAVLASHGQPPLEATPLAPKSLNVAQDQINAALLMLIRKQAEQIDQLRRRVNELGQLAGKPGPR